VNVDDEDEEPWVLVALRPLLETLSSRQSIKVFVYILAVLPSSSSSLRKKKQSNTQCAFWCCLWVESLTCLSCECFVRKIIMWLLFCDNQ
jgi:hypothetical protein